MNLGDSSSGGTPLNINLGTINGDVGIANYGNFSESAPSVVNGEVIVGSGVTTSGAHGTNTGGIVVNNSLVSAAASVAFSASNYFAGLAPTMSAGRVQ